MAITGFLHRCRLSLVRKENESSSEEEEEEKERLANYSKKRRAFWSSEDDEEEEEEVKRPKLDRSKSVFTPSSGGGQKNKEGGARYGKKQRLVI